MIEQGPHAVLPETTHDEEAYLSFLGTLKTHLQSEILPGNQKVYKARVEPAFRKKHGRAPKTRQEIRPLMERESYYQWYSDLQFRLQWLSHQAVGDNIHRQLPELVENFRAVDGKKRKLGSLTLDTGVKPPRYLSAVDIHYTPGNYFTDTTEDDVTAGAHFDRHFFLYVMGGLGEYNDRMGASGAAFIKNQYPGFKPLRILEMGCTTGNSLIPYLDTYPDAEVHGIDIGAPVLRYGHARAESLGKAIHFSQQDAEHTNFKDASFDLIVSHILLHETSRKAVHTIMRECHRLLRPGGIVAHLEAPVRTSEMEPYDAFIRDWSTHNNAEPFWGTLHDMDLLAPAVEAGFKPGEVIDTYAPMVTADAAYIMESGTMAQKGPRYHAYGARKGS